MKYGEPNEHGEVSAMQHPLAVTICDFANGDVDEMDDLLLGLHFELCQPCRIGVVNIYRSMAALDGDAWNPCPTCGAELQLQLRYDTGRDWPWAVCRCGFERVGKRTDSDG